MKTAGQLSSVTAILPSSKTGLKPNTEDNIEMHAVPWNAKEIFLHETCQYSAQPIQPTVQLVARKMTRGLQLT
jgi:hypothetical protein